MKQNSGVHLYDKDNVSVGAGRYGLKNPRKGR